MACCCGSGSGSASALPILTGAGQPVTPPDPTTHLPLYRDVTTGHLWLWSGGAWSITRAPIDWMIGALASTPLQPTDFITINRGGTPGNPDSGTYYVATIQDLAAAVGTIVGATTVSSADAAIDVTPSGSNYAVGFNPQGGAAEIAGDTTALATLFGAATISLLSDVSNSVPNVNDALVWNGSAWAPVPLSALTNDSFVNGGSITGGGTTLTLTYNTGSLPPVNINVANIVPNYDNSTSGLSSTNMQAAIDELAAAVAGSMTNIGTGQAVYAGYNSGSGFHEFRSIDGANGVSVSISGNTIMVQFDPGSLTPVAIQQLATMIAADATAIATIAGAIDLGDLADVNTAGASNGDVLTYQSGQWVPAAPPSGGGGPGPEEVLQGICADCFDDALAQGLGAGDYWLNTGTNPPMLFQWDGTNLTGVSPLPDIFVCCNSFDVYVQCNGQMVGAMAVGPELAHMVMTVFCAASEADALAAGLQAHQYWLDTSVTPPQLMHYNGTTSTLAPFTPKVVMCCNTGDVYIRCESGASSDLFLLGSFGGGGIPAGNVQVNACPAGPINADTDAQTAFCTLSDYVTHIPASNVTVTACPSGPINTNTDLQTALCTLSATSGGPLPFTGAPTAEIVAYRRNTIAVNYVIARQTNVSSLSVSVSSGRLRLNLTSPIQAVKLGNAQPHSTVLGHGVALISVGTVFNNPAPLEDEGVSSSIRFRGPNVSVSSYPSLAPISYVDVFSGPVSSIWSGSTMGHISYLVVAIYDAVI